jgi:hypothetical protein
MELNRGRLKATLVAGRIRPTDEALATLTVGNLPNLIFAVAPRVGWIQLELLYRPINNDQRNTWRRPGPAFGGCRMYPYASEQHAMTDVLRLSRGMTYKAAICELPYGGGDQHHV